jgi:polygalacturonase
MPMLQRFSRPAVLPGFVLILIALSHCASAIEPAKAGDATSHFGGARAWSQVPDILKRIVAPEFASRQFNITNYGAIAGGTNNCSDAFEKSIAACVHSGGGRVIVPPGNYLTGPIHLKSGVELHLDAGAELIFSDRFEDYLPPVLVRVGGVEAYNYSPLIYARDCTNVAVTGKGRLNGNAKAWWNWKSRESKQLFDMGARGVPVEQRVFGNPEAAIRPSFLSLIGCTNVLLEDFTIGSGPNWTIHPIYCENVTIRRVTVDTDGPNNDGIDPDSCRDVLIEDCHFSTGDDCVVLKSGYNEDGWRVGRPTENVIMRRCSSRRGHGGLVVGSEMSGDVRNVFVYDCEFEGTDRAIRIKSRRGRGGVVENIYARNLKVKDLLREVVILSMEYSSDQKQAANEKPPVFRNMEFENISGDGAPVAVLIQALEDSPVENISFEHLAVKATKGIICSNVKGLRFSNVDVRSSQGPVFDLTNASDVIIRGAAVVSVTDVFLKAEGPHSEGIRIENSDLSKVRRSVVRGTGVSTNAVIIQ